MTALPSSFLTLPLAHRALHEREDGRIENSPAAIEAAVAAGYGIELDIQLSSDGEAMVFHDDTLDRLTAQKGPVSDRTASQLGRIKLTDGKGDTIPTLAEVLQTVDGLIPLLIELKDQTGSFGPVNGLLEGAVARALRDYPGEAAVMSFNPYSVLAFGARLPDRPRGLTTCPVPEEDAPDLPAKARKALTEISFYDRAGASFVSHQWDDLSSPAIARLKAAGVPVLCWTIRSPEAEAEARRIADNVTFEGYRPVLPSS